MTTLMKTCLLSALLMLPVGANAQTATTADAAPKAAGEMTMNCPMMAGASMMQKDLGAMMSDMDAMRKSTNDPAMKARMDKMHEQISAMMTNMQKMGGGMMQGQQATASASGAAPK